ncbi:DUF4091 domain-containing protein [Algoriphagus aestuarii]|nr:DUF4091 domain-containing protein [Algoriphagus aestuarii]
MKRILAFIVLFLNIACFTQAQVSGFFTSFENFGTDLPGIPEFKAWRNETLIVPLVINADPLRSIDYNLSIASKNAHAEFAQLHFIEGDLSAGNCGEAIANGTFEKKMFPDRVEVVKNSSFEVNTASSFGIVKLTLESKLKPGKYPLKLTFTQSGKSHTLNAIIKVIDRKLPDFSSLDYRIDFWQFPQSISSYYEIRPYSQEHWDDLGSMFEQLKAINQSVVTTSIFYDLYNTALKPKEQMMIQIIKNPDGSFSYDYSLFEKFVELAEEKGIKNQIAVHNLFPWNLTYFYFDELSGEVKSFKSAPGTEVYRDFWKPFLVDFASFLKTKNWLDKTVFWVDERDFSTTELLIDFVKEVVPEFKFGYSGTFSPDLSQKIYDYSLSSNIILEPDQLAARKSNGKITTLYTSCFETQPNMLLASNYNDIYFLVMLSKAQNYDGMLRWAFNIWSPQIMKSALFSDLPSGDSHFVYPDEQVSIRYLLLIDALEEVLKVQVKSNLDQTQQLLKAHTRYFLRNNKTERNNMVIAMKNYLND